MKINILQENEAINIYTRKRHLVDEILLLKKVNRLFAKISRISEKSLHFKSTKNIKINRHIFRTTYIAKSSQKKTAT